MDFYAVLDQVVDLLRSRQRATYRTLKRQFNLDDAALEDLKEELLFTYPQIADEDGRGLVWTGDTGSASAAPPSALSSTVAETHQAREPLSYTPSYLAEKILTSRSVLEGERKQVTVLFADLKGSTELIADLDSEAARQLLDPALHHMMEAVHRYEGTVNQVLGDGIMALFGAPLAHEDHALRACYGALAMQVALRRYGEEVRRSHGLEMHMRVGLNSGEVVVRTISNDLHMDYSAVGQTTHLAARMEQLAPPGGIRLTASTFRLVEGLVQVQALGQFPVKGLPEPVEVFELTGASAVHRRLQAVAARGLTRFVGRQHELETLRQAREQAATGHGQIVAIVGEAGVGKSRLVYEFTRSDVPRTWLVLEGASVSYGKATPYFPVLDLLRRYMHLEEHDEARTIRAKVTGHVLTLDAALQDIIPALLALLDVAPDDSPFLKLDPAQRRQRTLDTLKRLLMRETQVQPLLLVFEDLHWIDAETQALLDNLVGSLPTARVLLLVNYRPEYQHSWGSKTYYAQLRLDPLPPAGAAEVLAALLGDAPSLVPLTQLLMARTEGNPFFLEESVRTLVETGILVGERGTYQLAQALPTIQVPTTVQAVLAARIDRLPPEEKILLQTAAAVGTEVPVPILQAITELPEAVFHRGLAHLQAAEFLYEPRLFPEHAYTFKHALTHEVAYSSLLHERRRVLHARIVETLEKMVSDRIAEQVERLAHHALRGEVWAKAVTYCQQAGARAHDRAAFREAVVPFEQALQALAYLPEDGDTRGLAIDLRLALAASLAELGEYGRQHALLGEAEALARDLDDRVRLVRVLARIAMILRLTGDSTSAMVAGQQALALAGTLSDSASQWQASLHLGQACYAMGDFGRATELLRRNVEAIDRASDTPRIKLRLWSQAWLARALSALGAFAEGRRHGEEALHLAMLEDQSSIPLIAHGCLGHLYLAQGDLERAIRVLEQGLVLCRASGNRTWLRETALGLGYAAALQGRITEGHRLLEEGISASISTGALQDHARWISWLSEICRLAGRGEEAWQHACRALDLARQHRVRANEARALHQLGVVQTHAAPPDAAQAEAYYQQALALADEWGMRPLQAHCHLGLGKLYAKLEQREQACTELSTAIALYRSMEMTYWLPQAEVTLAEVEAR